MGRGTGDGRPQLQMTILGIEGCPHVGTMAERVRQALVLIGDTGSEPATQTVSDPGQARQMGFAGSPTLLVDGRDPFPGTGPTGALSCRLYPTPEGTDGAPTVEQIVRALAG